MFEQPVSAIDSRTLPVSLAELKEQLRIEHSDADDLLSSKIASATNEAELFIGSPIMARSYQLVLPRFLSCGIELHNPPIRSITSITYYDTAGDSQTLDSGTYYLLQSGAYPVIKLVPDESWPSTQARDNAVTATYEAGYSDTAANVPAAIREAITLRAATRYEMSEEAGTGAVAWVLPERIAFESLLRPYRLTHV